MTDATAALQQQVVWQPQPGPQTMFCRCPHFEVLYGGARGGGKSDAVLGEWLMHAHLYGKDAIGLVVRRELVQLRELIERSKVIYSPLGADWSAQDKIWRFPNGARLNFAHLDNDADAEKYQGWSLTRVYIEELGNFPNPDPIMKLMATLRSGASVPVGFRATANPGGAGHVWIKQRYIDPAPLGMKVLKTEFKNPFGGEVVTRDRVFIPAKVSDNRYLGTEYVSQLQMSGNTQLVRAWLLGDWDVVLGAFFDNWDQRKHVIKPFALPQQWLRFMSGDWGSAKPFAFHWHAICGDATPITRLDGTPGLIPRGAIIVYRECYGSLNHNNTGVKLTVEQVADQLLELESREPRRPGGKSGVTYRVLDPACFANEGGPTIAERFGNKKLYFQPANNRRTRTAHSLGGWDLVRERLDGEDGRPMIYFFDTCVDIIRTLPALQHDQHNPEDVDTEGEDHAPDSVRYGVMSRPWIRSVAAADPVMQEGGIGGTGIKVDLNRLFEQSERKEARRLKLVGGTRRI